MVRDIMELVRETYCDIDRYYVEAAIKSHFENKKWIADTLDLNEGNNWQFRIGLPATMENKPHAVNIMRMIGELTGHIYTPLDLNFMVARKNKYRITRILDGLWEQFYERYNFHTDYTWKEIYLDIRKSYPNADATRKEVWLCWYGDYVKNGRTGMITLNPYDYFTLSGDMCSYSSCVRVGGEYDNTILHYLASDCVMPFFVLDDNDKKIGRSLIYLNKWKLFQGRCYGSVFDSDLLLIRDYIHEKIGGRWINHNKAIERDEIKNTTTAYVDYGYGVTTSRKHDDGYDSAPLQISKGRCLKCNGIIDIECSLSCSYCNNKHYCDWCRNGFTGEAYKVQNDTVCEYCFERYACECQHCNEIYHEDDIRIVEGENVCQECRDNDAYCCDGCGKWFWETTCINDAYYCDDCRYEKFVCCEKCGEYIVPEKACETGDQTTLCESCAEELILCDDCFLYFQEDQVEEHHGQHYCLDCIGARKERDENRIAVNG